MTFVRIEHRGETRRVVESDWQRVFSELVERLGAFEPGVTRIVREEGESEVPTSAPTPEAPVYSDFGAGKQVVDAAAEARLTALHGELAKAGVKGMGDGQLYSTGTRMAEVGYDTQRSRAVEHAGKRELAEVAAELEAAITAERRIDREVKAADFGAGLTMNGALRFDGYKVREQAVRGLLARLKSPALTYVLGLRARLSDADATDAQKASDKAELLEVLRHECTRFDKVALKLRMRDGLGDIFATVSPDYAAADFPAVKVDLLAGFPADAKGSFAYDPESTAWELRASVWTPTPVDLQAVGEPFEGFVSAASRDNGTRSRGIGGGMLVLACLNAGVYEVESHASQRRHVGNILGDTGAAVRQATQAIRVLTAAWGTARTAEVELPKVDGKLIPIGEAIPGFYRMMLTSRRGELVGVLPGRTAAHVEGLTFAYGGERRNPEVITRADLAQGFTKYIQTVPAAARRDAERAIGRWVVKGEPVSYLAE